jgi:hypothetical protein
MECEQSATHDRKPTVRQLYALAILLCEQAAEPFPETGVAASELIKRLSLETGSAATTARRRIQA